MRISDWSSDVCSSDLGAFGCAVKAAQRQRRCTRTRPTAAHRQPWAGAPAQSIGRPASRPARDGMEPTPRAEAIAGVVQQLLELRRDLAEGGQTFSPDRLKREFIIAGSEIAHLVVLTELHSAARFEAPHNS